MKERERQITWILAVLLCVLCLDQVSKAVIRYTIAENSVTLAGHEQDIFWFTHQTNEGLVWGMFQAQPLIARAAPLLATVVLLYLFKHLDPASRVQALAYGMVAGGAVGNLIDRFWRGGVTDFLQFHFRFLPDWFPGKLYPAFNVADSAICVGVLLLVVGWGKPGKTDVADAV